MDVSREIDLLPAWEVQMEQQSKTKFHITWDEAWRAEKAREKARQACCNEIPTAGPLKLFAANLAREFPKLKATAFRFLSLKDH